MHFAQRFHVVTGLADVHFAESFLSGHHVLDKPQIGADKNRIDHSVYNKNVNCCSVEDHRFTILSMSKACDLKDFPNFNVLL